MVLSLIYQQAIISGYERSSKHSLTSSAYKDFLIQKTQDTIELVSKKSKVEASLEGDNLKINFLVVDGDKEKVNDLLSNLGVDQKILEGMVLNLDPTSSSSLKRYLPQEANLKLEDKKITLKSNSLSDIKLSSGIPEKKYELASNSAKLTISESVGSYDIEIYEPSEILNYAQSSELIHLSDSLSDLFPILSKIVRIDLSLKDNNLSGEIVLR